VHCPAEISFGSFDYQVVVVTHEEQPWSDLEERFVVAELRNTRSPYQI